MKKLLILTIIIVSSIMMLLHNVTAIQDINLYVDNKKSDLCLSIDDFDNPVCNNQTMIIEGTNDHIIYIIPESEITYNSTLSAKLRYILLTPLTLLSMVLFIFILIIFVIGIIYSFTKGSIKIR